MKIKIILVILMAAILSIGTAQAFNCQFVPAECSGFGPGCFWRDIDGPPASISTCCTDELCTVPCDSPLGENVAVGSSSPTDVGNVGWTVDLGPFSQERANYHVYMRFDIVDNSGCDVVVDDGVGGGGAEVGTDMGDGTCLVDIAHLFELYNGGISGFDSGADPAEAIVSFAVDDAYGDSSDPVDASITDPGGAGTPSQQSFPISYINVTGVGNHNLYSSIANINSDSKTSMPAKFGTSDNIWIQVNNTTDNFQGYIELDLDSLTQYYTTWDTSGNVDWSTLGSNSEGYTMSSSGNSWPLSGYSYHPNDSVLNYYVKAGQASYGFCCSGSVASTTCTGVTVTYEKVTIDSEDYFVCRGMIGSGASSQGETNLTINDSAEGGNVETDIAATFYAHYYNKTDGTPLTGNNEECKVNPNGTEYTMSYNGGSSRWEYVFSDGFPTIGTKVWNVTCNTTAAGHFNLTASDDIEVIASTAVPEFSDIGWILAAVLGGGGFILMRRKRNHF